MEDLLKSSYHHLIKHLELKTHRFLYRSFNLKNRLTGIMGPRGVGKTTLMLQYLKEHFYKDNSAFYFTADHIYFHETSLLQFVHRLYSDQGIRYFFIDEIHKYKNWTQELKNIYDSLPLVFIIFSGSSSLDLTKGTYDLSRRAKLYQLPGLSFREYLYLRTGEENQTIILEELLNKAEQYNTSIGTIPKVLGYFKEYLVRGYYPFVFEDEDSYQEKVVRIIEKTLYEDITEYYNLKTENIFYLKKILGFLASIPPGQVNVHNIAKNISIDFKTAFNYLSMLQETGLVRMLYSEKGGNDILRKPEKVYMNNTSLLYALDSVRGIEPSIGNVRELFLLQAISDAGYHGFFSEIGDLCLEGKILEIGGKNKSMAQLKKANTTGLLVKDNINNASPHVIPLYFFGFLY